MAGSSLCSVRGTVFEGLRDPRVVGQFAQELRVGPVANAMRILNAIEPLTLNERRLNGCSVSSRGLGRPGLTRCQNSQ